MKEVKYMNWYQLYLEDIQKKKSIDVYIEDKIKFKKPLIELIRKYAKNKKIIEAGCGTGVVSTYLASINFDVTAVDIDNQMLELAKSQLNSGKWGLQKPSIDDVGRVCKQRNMPIEAVLDNIPKSLLKYLDEYPL